MTIYNQEAGFTKKDDPLPKMLYQEPLPPLNKVVMISDEEMDSTFNLFDEWFTGVRIEKPKSILKPKQPA